MQQKRTSRKRRRTATPHKPRGSRRVSSTKTKTKAAKVLRPVLKFRNRVPEDDAFILRLTEEQLGEVHQSAFGEPFPRDQFMYFIQSGAPVTVFEAAGESVGYYSYLIGHDGKMHISALVIDPKFQSKGIGTTVMKHLEQQAAGNGVHTLEVFVQANNEKSIQFTQQLGFVEVFRMPPNTICFQKRLQVQAANHVPQ